MYLIRDPAARLAFVRAALADPGDALLPGVIADYLEDRGTDPNLLRPLREAESYWLIRGDRALVRVVLQGGGRFPGSFRVGTVPAREVPPGGCWPTDFRRVWSPVRRTWW